MSITIQYFDFTYGRAEPLKMMLAHSGTMWKDDNLDFAKWG